jgi:MoaA/NifB/PqqE/SkfB family radical SAM enzyme
MTNTTDLMGVLARISQLAHAGGLSDSELEKAVNRIVAGATMFDESTQDQAPQVKERLFLGLRKILEDDPMLITWALKLAARLGDNPWKMFLENFLVRLVVDRRTILDKLTAELGHSPPITLVVNPTMACNLACRGCYAYEFSRKEAMPRELFAKILSEARDMGTRFITVTGGEPFFYDGLLDVVEEFHDLTFMSYTNGTLIDDRTADRLAELGNFFPAISVEGYEKETTDRRGEGVYGDVLDTMARLRERGIMFGISVTPTRLNTDVVSSDPFIDFYIDKGATFVWLFTYIPVGLNPEIGLMATPQQREQLRQASVRWRRTKPIFLGDFWNDGATCGGCLSASRYAFVTPDGKVQPCTFVHFYTHNAKDHTLQEIFKSPFFRGIRDVQPYDRNLLRPCKIIDHPHILRRLVEQHGAKPSYPGAETIVRDARIRRHLDQYSREYAEIAEPAWKGPDYQDGRRALVPFSGFVDLYTRFQDRMAAAERVTESNRLAAALDGADPRSAGARIGAALGTDDSQAESN